MRLGATTDAGFRERWALFWANHFTVSATKAQMATLVGPFEQEAIRPHVFGRFEDLLVASSSHPAMLLYLDQAQSVGPDSHGRDVPRSAAARRPASNENLAREIMELHTVGLGAGYTPGRRHRVRPRHDRLEHRRPEHSPTTSPASSYSGPPRMSPEPAPSWASATASPA